MAEGKTNFTWQAPEFRSYHRPLWWYAVLVVIVGLLASYQIYIDDKFGAFTTLIIGILIVVFTRQNPQTVTVSLSKDGVSTGSALYPYSKFKYFWIVDDGHHKTLNFEASTYFSQTVILELMEQDVDEIREFLSSKLPEEESLNASFSQKVARRLRL